MAAFERGPREGDFEYIEPDIVSDDDSNNDNASDGPDDTAKDDSVLETMGPRYDESHIGGKEEIQTDDDSDGFATDDSTAASEARKLKSELSEVLREIAEGRLDPEGPKATALCRNLKEMRRHCTWLPEDLSIAIGGGEGAMVGVKTFFKLLLRVAPKFPLWTNGEDVGETTLHRATYHGYCEAVEFLCEISAFAVQALGTANTFLNTCLHIAIQKELKLDFLKKVIDLTGKATVDAAGRDKNTPLHLAVDFKRCKPGQKALVEHLLSWSGKALTKNNEDKLAPLQYLIKTRQENIQSDDELEALTRKLECLKLAAREAITESRANPAAHEQPAPVAVEEQSGAKEKKARKVRRKKAHKTVNEEIAQLEHELRTKTEQRKEAEEIEELLKLHCLRLNRERDETIKLLYGDNQPLEISFDLSGYKQIKEQDLKDMRYLHFENTLQYLVLPNLSVIPSRPPGDELPVSKGRCDYWWIFEWLRKKKVKTILRVIVQDRHPVSHSDEMIERCLKDFNVEVWDWNKLDICSSTIKKAATGVKDLTLYSSGSNAVLRSWSSTTGLVELPDLKILRLKIHQGLESLDRTRENVKGFETALRGQFCHHDEGLKCSDDCLAVFPDIVDSEGDVDMLATDLDGEPDEEKQQWLVCMEKFAVFVRNYEDPWQPDLKPPEIKVALIDDGVDTAHASLSCIIADGKSFSQKSNGQYNSYYKSSRGHGTIMATLIRKICPGVKLYVARLNEERTNNGFEITAASAALAVQWAVSKGVHIISMSWTINSTKRNENAIEQLTTQINAAATAKILLFCSVSDQGVKNEGTFPANCNRGKTFRIGAATPSGSAWEWIGVNDVDYILPGTGLRVDTRGPSAKGLKPVSGSSLATALASGLAAVILYCVALRDPSDLDRAKGHESMKKILDNINATGDRTKPLYLQVWDKFDPAKETQISANEDKDRLQSVVTKLMAPLI